MQFKPKPINLFQKCRRLHTYTISLTVLIDLLTGLKSQSCIKVKYKKTNDMKTDWWQSLHSYGSA